MPSILNNETGVQVTLEDSPWTGSLLLTLVVPGAMTDAEALDLADRVAASDYATSRLTGTPNKVTVVTQGVETIYP